MSEVGCCTVLPESARRMHFTLCMLKLHSHAQVDEMKEVADADGSNLACMTLSPSGIEGPVRSPTLPVGDGALLEAQVQALRLCQVSRQPQPLGKFDVKQLKGMGSSHLLLPTKLCWDAKARNLVSAQNLMSQRLLSSDGQHAEVKLHATLMNTKYARSRFDDRSAPRENFDASVLMERFGQARPCIDIHNGQVKQIVGGTLKDDSKSLVTNFEASQPSSWFAERYRDDGLGGGHAIMLGASEANKAAALAALKVYPGGLQVGGGINAENAMEFIDAGNNRAEMRTCFLARCKELAMSS
ncbi:HISN3 [Symbiodinium sp. CCMP2592]|nr:HISN3 [Symbiodinium sp. CCMP2592]